MYSCFNSLHSQSRYPIYIIQKLFLEPITLHHFYDTTHPFFKQSVFIPECTCISNLIKPTIFIDIQYFGYNIMVGKLSRAPRANTKRFDDLKYSPIKKKDVSIPHFICPHDIECKQESGFPATFNLIGNILTNCLFIDIEVDDFLVFNGLVARLHIITQLMGEMKILLIISCEKMTQDGWGHIFIGTVDYINKTFYICDPSRRGHEDEIFIYSPYNRHTI